MLVYAVNLENAAKVRPEGEGDWLDFYQERMDMMGFRSYITRVLGGICPACWADAVEVGALVGFLSWENRRAYVVPLCRACSRRRHVIALPSYLMCLPVPKSTPMADVLCYPSEAMARFRLQNPRDIMFWNGHPTWT